MKSYITIPVAFLFVGCFGLSCFAACPSMDFTEDCRVNFTDFAVLANQWLMDYDSNDLATMALEWLTEGIPTNPEVMLWVSVNEPNFTGEMSKYETTNAQYCQFLNATKASNQITVYNNIVYATSDTSHSQPYFETYASNSYSQITYSDGTFSVRSRDSYSMDNHPVVMVSWYGATAFCNYYGYRLPTEWEWQAVADFDGSYTYGCGTSIDPSKANYDSNNPLGLTSYPYTSPVGYYPTYGYGMCDMAGNVYEWTSTVGGSSGTFRVIRGGFWGAYDYECTVSTRGLSSLNNASISIGFRACH